VRVRGMLVVREFVKCVNRAFFQVHVVAVSY